MELVRPEVPTLENILQLDLTAFLGRWQRMTARSSLRRIGKAEPIPGQQIGDLLATAAKLNPLASIPDPILPAIHGLHAENSIAEKWPALVIGSASGGKSPGDVVWGQAVGNDTTLQKEVVDAWQNGYTLVSLSPLGWQDSTMLSQTQEFIRQYPQTRFSVPRDEVHHFDILVYYHPV